MLMVPNLRLVEPNNIYRKVPTRKPNAEMRLNGAANRLAWRECHGSEIRHQERRAVSRASLHQGTGSRVLQVCRPGADYCCPPS